MLGNTFVPNVIDFFGRFIIFQSNKSKVIDHKSILEDKQENASKWNNNIKLDIEQKDEQYHQAGKSISRSSATSHKKWQYKTKSKKRNGEKKGKKNDNNANEIAKCSNAQCSPNTNDQFFFNESPLMINKLINSSKYSYISRY